MPSDEDPASSEAVQPAQPPPRYVPEPDVHRRSADSADVHSLRIVRAAPSRGTE